MTDQKAQAPSEYQRVLRLLEAHRKLLADAGVSRELLDVYREMLNYLRGVSPREFAEFARRQETRVTKNIEIPSEEILANSSLDEIERLVADESAPRKLLEAIAVARFKVPKGSLRSLSNVKMLRDRIMTHIQNERTHQTISSVARQSR